MYIKNAKSCLFTIGLCLLFMFSLMPPLAPVQAAQLEWSGTTFNEDAANDGSIGNPITIVLDPLGGTTTFVDSPDLVADGAVIVANVPAGLTCRVRVFDTTHCRIYLDGNATAHQAADSITNLTIQFQQSAFAHTSGGMDNRRMEDIHVTFTDNAAEPPADIEGRANWPTTGFNEADANDGSIENTLTVTLGQVTPDFIGFEQSADLIGEGRVQVNNVPAGLSCQVATTSRNACTIALIGNATNHAAANSITNLEVIFQDSAFDGSLANQVENSAKYDIPVTFIDAGAPPVEPPATHDIVATFSMGSTVYYVNGVPNNMDAVPYSENGRVFVPVRYLAYCLGMTEDNVSWDGPSNTATISENGFNVMLTIGSLWINVDGTPQLMDVVPQIQGERILLPARFVAEAFGATVQWVPEDEMVIVNRDL